ncbi:MAG: hypothetical protein L0Z70_03835 [Chloroflexi bacterium]|nr:hypothetical protein [Chloroflexota bacterium]
MQELATTLFVFLGFVMRLALPLAITGLLIWLLRRLDQHWQREAARQGQETLTLHVLNTGCWDIQHCSEEQRAVCSAYAHRDIPCWQYYRQQEGRLREACLECKIFQEAPLPFAV